MTQYTPTALKVLLIFLLLGGGFVSRAVADDAAVAAPKVTIPTLPYTYPFDDPEMAQRLKSRTFVVELFTSLDCLFCPRAEQLAKDLAGKTSGIVLACHTDPEGADYPLARDFCIMRQTRYAERLSDGLLYTPQMILNGHVDAVGHEFDDVGLGLRTALADTRIDLKIRPTSETGIYAIDLPKVDLPKGHPAEINLLTVRKPYTLPKTMRQSVNRPDPLIHVIKRLVPMGGWDGRVKTVTLPFVPDDDEIGFVILIQQDDGKMIGVLNGLAP